MRRQISQSSFPARLLLTLVLVANAPYRSTRAAEVGAPPARETRAARSARRSQASKRPLVIAHRGASGYLPEHTLAAKALAYGMGADYLEQDVVLTKDGRPVVFHDIHLDTTTDVAERYPKRSRADGRYYVIDFTLAELRTLTVHERTDHRTGKAVYPRRFPVGRSRFYAPTLGEEIELIQGLNRSTGRRVGLYTEIKAPAFHRREGRDISRVVVETLARYGYRDRADLAFVQCFDAAETRRIRTKLACELRLIQLLGNDPKKLEPGAVSYARMRTPAGLREIAEYAEGIGPALEHIVDGVDSEGRPRITSLVRDAHAAGLLVHPYTFRSDALPKYAKDLDELLRIFVREAQVDGLFTDFPDRVVTFLRGPTED